MYSTNPARVSEKIENENIIYSEDWNRKGEKSDSSFSISKS